MNRTQSTLLATLLALSFSHSAPTQCPLQWQPGDPIPFAHGDANAMTVWDPDGAGPAPAVLVVGGLVGAGDQLATSLATFDGVNWGALGAPPLPNVTALTTWNGLLVAAGGIGAPHTVATWNGSAWSVLGTVAGTVNTMAVFNGDLFVGGFFTSVGGVPANNLARWNGASWANPGGGVVGEVRAMVVFGSLYVGGFLTQAGPLPVGNLAIWNGTSWAAGATFNGRILSLAMRSGTTTSTSFLFAGGEFSSVAGVAAMHVARFTVSTNAWTAIPGLPGTSCSIVHVRNTGLTTFQLHAAIEGSSVLDKVWRLNGTAWQTLGAVFDETEPLPRALAFFNGQYVAAFAAHQIAPSRLDQAVRVHDGTAWLAARGPGFDDRIAAVAARGGEIVVGGRFQRYGSTTLSRVARGGPAAWLPLGSGIGGGIGVTALCTMPDGDLIAGGDFDTADGLPAFDVARWNGSNWSALGSGLNGRASALLPLPNGDLIVGGSFSTAGGVPMANIARWNGAAWSPLGLGIQGDVKALARMANGDIVATGSFLAAGGQSAAYIARWNGALWQPLGAGLSAPGLALAVLPDDSIVVGGGFAQAGGMPAAIVARWDGSAWNAQSSPAFAWDNDVAALLALPNGDYLAGGATSFFGLGGPFPGGNANLARHSGGSSSLQWSALDLRGVEVAAAALLPNGDVVVGGTFDGAGGLASHDLAVLRPTCPATAVAYGSGCTSSAGFHSLAATALPWTGGRFRARATGMPNVAIAIAVTGFTQLAVPLPAVLPQGLPGCTVLVAPDALDLALPIGGVVDTQIALPATVALAGQSFHHQVVVLETDLAGNILAATSSNALTLTIGVL